jgi:GT2 family glycosyltransferase
MTAADHQVSIIVPTKNRLPSLQAVVSALFEQTRLPAEVIIVDQSDSDEGRRRIGEIYGSAPPAVREAVTLRYHYEPDIPGAAPARNRGMDLAKSNIWLFLDDDMLPESDFLEQILTVYDAHPEIDGVSGIITNYPAPGRLPRMWGAIFLQGPFRDERQAIYWRADDLKDRAAIRVRKFGSGLMSFRAEAVRTVRFDDRLRGLPPGEDVDFCARLGGAVLVIAPRARIAHNPNAVGRARDHWLREYAQGKLYAYYRNWQGGAMNRACCAWFVFGCALITLYGCLRRGSLEPWGALRAGLRMAAQLGHATGSSAASRP